MSEKLEFTSQNQSEQKQSAAQIYEDLVARSKKTEQIRGNALMKGYAAAVTALGIAVVVLGAAVIVMALGWSKAQGKIVPEIVEVEKETVVTETEYIPIDPSEEYSHQLGSDSFLLNDSSYGPIWVPALTSVRKNEYIPELFIKNELDGTITYDDPSAGIHGIPGIDVSVHQGYIDWEEVRAAGYEFAMIRCANRGYVTGLVVEDANFKQNIENAIDAGMKVGVYIFSQALTTDEALEEAEFVIDLLDGYDIDYPVAFDWEVVNDPDGDTARTKYIDPQQLTDNFLVFAKRLEIEGYTPVIYANKKTAVWKYDLSRVADYDIWFAGYDDTPTLFYDCSMWQYSSKGQVPGIDGSVDLNLCFKDYSEE